MSVGTLQLVGAGAVADVVVGMEADALVAFDAETLPRASPPPRRDPPVMPSP